MAGARVARVVAALLSMAPVRAGARAAAVHSREYLRDWGRERTPRWLPPSLYAAWLAGLVLFGVAGSRSSCSPSPPLGC